VRSALDASRFDWDLVDEEITIRIIDCGCAGASPGEILLDEAVLTDPRFGPKYAWGIVQHEYAHQVAFFLLDAAARRRAQAWLGGSDWCSEDETVEHDDRACERFASSLAWAYWAVHETSCPFTPWSRSTSFGTHFASFWAWIRKASSGKGCQADDRRPH
jgi:hypothetical protein